MRTKLPLLALIALVSAVALVGATQQWATITLAPGAATVERLAVAGHEVNASVTPVAVAGLTAALALTIAGPIFRRVLGVLLVLLGVGIVLISVAGAADPAASVSGVIADLTAISGSAQGDLIRGSSVSVWPAITAIAGAVLAVAGAAVVVLAGRWRAAGRRYARAGNSRGETPRERTSVGPDRISDWESLNEGDDPSESFAAGAEETGAGSQESPSNR